MKQQGFFFRKRWFIQVYITIAIFTLLLISLVFFWFRSRSMEDLKASQTEALKNTSTIFQSQMDSFSLIAYQIYAMPSSTVLFTYPEEPVSFIIDISKQVQASMASNDLIDLVGLFDREGMVYTRQNRVISQESMNQLQQETVSVPVSESLFFLNAQQMAYGTPVRMICTLVGDCSSSTWKQGVVLCVNADKLADRLLSQLDSTYILDKEGNVLLSNQTELFGKQLPGYTQILSDFQRKGDPAAIITSINGADSIVCIINDEKQSFQVISIQPVNRLQESLNQSLWQLLLLAALLLTAAGIITLLLSKNLSQPADQLLTEIANLSPSPAEEKNMDHAMDPQLAHTMLQRTMHTIDQLQVVHRRDQQTQYLLGLMQDLSPEALFPTDSGWFLAVLQNDYPTKQTQNDPFSLIIETIAQFLETSNQWKNCVILPMQDGTAALICPDQGGEASKMIPVLRQELSELNTCSISFSISDKLEPGTLLVRYQNTLGRMRAKSLRGNGALITRIGEETAPQIKLSSSEVEEITSAVRSEKSELLPNLVHSLLEDMKTCHFEFTLHQLVDLCISLFQTGGTRIPKNTLLWGEVYQKLLECSNRDELEHQLVCYYQQAASHPAGTHKEEQIQAALTFINSHYADETLSMSTVAEHLHMSSSHFSRLFKEIMEQSFPSYVNRLRLSFAYQRLLEERNSTIEKIAQESGFYSSSYFTTLFRRQYGLSPSQVRQREFAENPQLGTDTQENPSGSE